MHPLFFHGCPMIKSKKAGFQNQRTVTGAWFGTALLVSKLFSDFASAASGFSGIFLVFMEVRFLGLVTNLDLFLRSAAQNNSTRRSTFPVSFRLHRGGRMPLNWF
jgi:hypothetical protein